MKKIIIKIICFAAIFFVLFHAAGSVFGMKWTKGEMMTERYSAYEKEGSVDVIYIGGSNIFAAAAPAVVWEESGITGFNLGASDFSMMLTYYQLKYALTEHTPSAVVLDVTGISVEKDPVNKSEAPFQKLMATIPDHGIRMELLSDMHAHWEDLDPVMYLFPLLRYHERWESLTEADFDPSIESSKYKEYSKGCYISAKVKKQDASGDIFQYSRNAVDDNLAYMQKICDLCDEKGIRLMLISCPNLESQISEHEAARTFAEENGLYYLEYASAEEIIDAGIDPEQDFYNENHLNIIGQKKFSSVLAQTLQEQFALPGHREDAALAEKWDETYEQYMEYYDKKYKKMTKEKK